MFATEADLRDAGHGVTTSAEAVYGTREIQAVPAWLHEPLEVLGRVVQKSGAPGIEWWLTLADLIAAVDDFTSSPRRPHPPLAVMVDATCLLREALGPQRLAEPPTHQPGLLDDSAFACEPPLYPLADAVARLADSLAAGWTADDDLAAQLEDLLDAFDGYLADALARLELLPSYGLPGAQMPVRGVAVRRIGLGRRHAAPARPPAPGRPGAPRGDSRRPP